jgi:hypothetical protein
MKDSGFLQAQGNVAGYRRLLSVPRPTLYEDIASKRSVGEFKNSKRLLTAVERRFIRIQTDNRGLTGVDTGYRRLNQYTHGWQKGDSSSSPPGLPSAKPLSL